MFGLTPLGVVHTAISLVAVAAGLIALIRFRAIDPHTGLGKVYVWTTILTSLTGFGIFQHGGFGKAHVLGILTLLVLAVAALAGQRVFGKASAYIATIAYSTTFFFHMVPGFTESLTRLPLAAPVFSSPDDPGLAKVIGSVLVVFLIGAWLQLRTLRAASRRSLVSGTKVSPA